jgi:hypothetical protein
MSFNSWFDVKLNMDTIVAAIVHGAAAMVIVNYFNGANLFAAGTVTLNIGIAMGIVSVFVDFWSPRISSYIQNVSPSAASA